MIEVKMYPAKNGDCLLISYGNADMKHILIDCGYTETFNNYLHKELISIHDRGQCLDKLIITHIDADHILGAISFLRKNNHHKFITIKEVWHNTFRHLFKKEAIALDKKKELVLKQIIQRGYPINKGNGEQSISAEQGTTVGALILEGGYAWNIDFDKEAVCIGNKREVQLDADCSIYLLSPDWQKLTKLKDLWKDELKRYGVSYNNDVAQLYDDAFEMLVSWEKGKRITGPTKIAAVEESITELLRKPFTEDGTATNGSSIAFILQIKSKRLLFLGDAHPNLIEKSLTEYQKKDKIVFDLIKVSHHGSFGNINKELLDKIDSDKYFISTNGGKHNHPDKETLAHIVTRDSVFHRSLYFNYETKNSEHFNRSDWMTKYNYSISYLNHEPYSIEFK